jgi:hypothetical protein
MIIGMKNEKLNERQEIDKPFPEEEIKNVIDKMEKVKLQSQMGFMLNIYKLLSLVI